jgi:hypothetical protein
LRSFVLSVSFADFRNREEVLNNDLKKTKKVRPLETTLRGGSRLGAKSSSDR